MEKTNRIEKLLWSIAFPGFGQLLNGQFLKGALFIGLEFLINIRSHLNLVILLSFYGRTSEAIAKTNYEWLMFYPCVYMFAMWDAFKQADENVSSKAVMPFVFGAYLGTVGVIFSKNRIGHILFGPVWMGIIGLLTGILLGFFIQKLRTVKNKAFQG